MPNEYFAKQRLEKRLAEYEQALAYFTARGDRFAIEWMERVIWRVSGRLRELRF